MPSPVEPSRAAPIEAMSEPCAHAARRDLGLQHEIHQLLLQQVRRRRREEGDRQCRLGAEQDVAHPVELGLVDGLRLRAPLLRPS
jgi:hypothetical protein